MHARLLFFSCCVALAAPPPLLHAAPEDSVVKVLATLRPPDPTRPWARGNTIETTGTGVVIDGKRLLTNAHVVMHATEVYVQPRPGDDKVEAKVQVLGPDVDLAILTVKDDGFFQKRPPLARSGKLPGVQDAVVVYGFPVGGQDLSVTKGTVARIDVSNYGHRGFGMTIQITAAVNPGNSGGPAVVADRMIGMVASRPNNLQQIGVVIPNEEIELFLEDCKDGRYDGKPMEATQTTFQNLENEALRSLLKVDPAIRGVLVRPPRQRDARYPLQAFDVVTKIGAYDLDNTGVVRLENGLRAPFQYLVPRLARDGSIPLTLWRDGKTFQASLPATREDNRVLRPQQGGPPAYFIYGPLVFGTPTWEDVSLFGRLNPLMYYDNSPLVTRMYDTVRFPGEELVVVSAPLFQHKIAKGYQNPVGKVVKEINGTRIKNLSHLVESLRDCKDEYLRFEFADDWSEVMVFNRQAMERATEEILEDHGIAPGRRGSAEAMKAWHGKGTSREK